MLYDGFDLCDPMTSVSMTINGPAPIILAMFLNAAIEQQLDGFRVQHNREPSEDEASSVRRWTLENVRGTVQADILKEDQGQNTCIFSTEFALKLMGDIQEYFVAHRVRNFYSVSISGYHIAEAGANPISQLAFTLSNGFTFVETYLARGMDIDDGALEDAARGAVADADNVEASLFEDPGDEAADLGAADIQRCDDVLPRHGFSSVPRSRFRPCAGPSGRRNACRYGRCLRRADGVPG